MHAAGQDVPFLYTVTVEGRSTADFDAVDDADDADAADAADAADNLETYRQEVEAARAAVTGKSLDLVVPSRGAHPERTRDLRWIYLHMLEEYARHNRHADLLGEAIDGRTGP